MEWRTLQVLEFDKILELIAKQSSSPYGARHIRARRPLQDREEVLALQRKVTEAKALLEKKVDPPFETLVEVGENLLQTQKGFTLSPFHLWQIYLHLKTIRLLKEFLKTNGKHAPQLSSLAEALHSNIDLENRILLSVNQAGEVLDTASEALKNLRHKIVKTQQVLHQRLQDFVRHPNISPLLQDPVVTQRGGRYVVPVKATHRREFKGILHDRSASGATLFMEPAMMVELNNRLADVKLQEKQEEGIVLQKLSHDVGTLASSLLLSIESVTQLDAAFAAARWSIKESAEPPTIKESPFIHLQSARHPLLEEKAVPVHVELGKDFRTLVITGPNTGGKTVSLKTIGLFCALAQSGFHLPMERGTVGLFDNILADIGDEQSIEQSLSTFSGHLSRIIAFLETVNSKTLVLLDELGAGTDPREGAALAMALLEHFHQSGALTVATTHYPELKTFAEKMPGMENASMGFNEQTLLPSFELLIGRPGRSLALTIAERLGLSRKILENAKLHMDEKTLRVDELLKTLEMKEAQLKEEWERLHASQKVWEEEQSLEKEKLTRLSREASEIFVTLKRFIDERKVILEESSKEELIEFEKSIFELESRFPTAKEETQQELQNESLREGSSVWVESLGVYGQVLELGEREALVQAGVFKVHRPLEDLRGLATPSSLEESFSSLIPSTKSVPSELHIRGMHVEDAISEVEKYLDDSILSHRSSVRIVHGKGEGILKKAVHELLKNHPMVVQYYMSDPRQGGEGVTVVELKSA